ncbi:SET domain-containing protein [Maricaulis parjimensis]|uniref:SET domain-containing protein n=1 Tax=Maricaulis parjimensis TaxID=144023 RepID=UPI00193A8171|nr:SET domain-containing protein [Maricaulis parjimensis]
MFLVETYLSPSPLEGLGVYAAQFIPKGQLLWVLDRDVDILLSPAQIAERPDVYKGFIRRYAYFDRTLGAYLLDGDHARFLNHADDPNLDFSAVDGSGCAARDIQADEEILCDYRQFMEDVVLLPARSNAFGVQLPA